MYKTADYIIQWCPLPLDIHNAPVHYSLMSINVREFVPQDDQLKWPIDTPDYILCLASGLLYLTFRFNINILFMT